MTNTTIFVIATLTGLLLATVGSQTAFGDSVIEILPIGDSLTTGAKAIPDWVKFNMRSYLDQQISERELLDAFDFLKKQGIMHESQEAAQEMAELRTENAALKKERDGDGKMEIGVDLIEKASDSSVDDAGRVKVQFHWDEETEQEALHHLRKAYDLNPALQTRVVQFDSNHDKWIDVLSIDWGSTSSKDCSAAERSSDENSSCWIRVSQTHAIPSIITTKVEPTGDMTLKGSKIHENAPAHDGGTVIVFTGLEFASETVHDLVTKGDTSTTGWDEGVAAFTNKYTSLDPNSGKNKPQDTVAVQELLNGFNHAIGNEILAIEGELAILEELTDMYTSSSTSSTRASTQYGESDFDFIQRYTSKIDTKIQSLQTGLGVLEEMLSTAGDDAQLANIDLQNSLQQQQQTLQTLSNTSKMLHDTAMSIIRKIG